MQRQIDTSAENWYTGTVYLLDIIEVLLAQLLCRLVLIPQRGWSLRSIVDERGWGCLGPFPRNKFRFVDISRPEPIKTPDRSYFC